MRTAILLFLVLLAVPTVLADQVNGHRGEPFILTTTCLHNGLMDAENATFRIINVDTNETITNETGMTFLSPGYYYLNQTFQEVGNYLAIEKCYYPGGQTAEGTDDITVSRGTLEWVLPILAALCLFFGWKRRPLVFLAAILLLFTAITFWGNLFIVGPVLLVTVALFYRALKLKTK